jgi:transposase
MSMIFALFTKFQKLQDSDEIIENQISCTSANPLETISTNFSVDQKYIIQAKTKKQGSFENSRNRNV